MLSYLLRSVEFSADLKSEFTGLGIEFVFLYSVRRAIYVGGGRYDVDAADLRRLHDVEDQVLWREDGCIVINVDYLNAYLDHLPIR